jgi:hypothetical protein
MNSREHLSRRECMRSEIIVRAHTSSQGCTHRELTISHFIHPPVKSTQIRAGEEGEVARSLAFYFRDIAWVQLGHIKQIETPTNIYNGVRLCARGSYCTAQSKDAGGIFRQEKPPVAFRRRVGKIGFMSNDRPVSWSRRERLPGALLVPLTLCAPALKGDEVFASLVVIQKTQLLNWRLTLSLSLLFYWGSFFMVYKRQLGTINSY